MRFKRRCCGEGRGGGVDGAGDRSPDRSARLTLSGTRPGHPVRVVGIEGGRRLVQRLAALGIVPGVTVVLERSAGPPLVRVGGTRIAVGREVAAAIEVASLEGTEAVR